jgi:hypothetical protein
LGGGLGGQWRGPANHGCLFHLLQEAEQKGNESHVYGQFIGNGCGVTGNPGPDPASGPGPYIIQLYKDPDWNSA